MLSDVGNSLPFTMVVCSLLPLRFLWKCFVFDQYEVEIKVLCGGNRRLTVKTADSSILSTMSPDMDYRNR